MTDLSFIKEIDKLPASLYRYSICTIVNNWEEYMEMVESFRRAGFSEELCEYLYIDNTKKNKYSAYDGLNRFLTLAKGEYIILVHQDVLLTHDTIQKLDKVIDEMNRYDATWAILGNSGAVRIKKFIHNVINYQGKHLKTGFIPSKVQTLDENFLLIRKAANLSFSHDLTGFHLYGTDICFIAQMLGWNAYVVDFLLTHKSPKAMSQGFKEQKRRFIRKYRKILKRKYLQTSDTQFYVSSSRVRNRLMNTHFSMFFVRLFGMLRNLISSK